MFKDAACYPIINSAWVMILIGAVFSCLLDFLQFAPIVGIAVSVFAAGFFSSFYLSIVSSTMTGSDRVPDWPSFTSFIDDIVYPFLTITFLLLISTLPGIAVHFTVPHGSAWFIPAIVTSAVYGISYFPMAVLGNCAFGGLHGALPHVVFPAIVRCLPSYLLSITALSVTVATLAISEAFAYKLPYLGWFIASVIGIYSMMFQGRAIGLVYRSRHEELQWK